MIRGVTVIDGAGALRLNSQAGKLERIGGVKYTIQVGIVYAARKLLADVAALVPKQRRNGPLSIRPGSVRQPVLLVAKSGDGIASGIGE